MSGSAGAVRVDRALRGRSAGAAAYPRFRVWAYNFVDIPANYHMAKYIRPVIRGLVSWCSHRQICITVNTITLICVR